MPKPPPKYLPRQTEQVDLLLGHLESKVPSKHIVRFVWQLSGHFNYQSAHDRASYMGNPGIHPREKLALWLYGTLCGIQSSTKLAHAILTDAAYQWILGGKSIGGRSLRRFRQENGKLFEEALRKSVDVAIEAGLLDPAALPPVAIDSFRELAHASQDSARSVERSKRRVAQLEARRAELKRQQAAADDEAERQRLEAQQAVLEARQADHQKALDLCQARGTTSCSFTNELARLMKVPSGGTRLCHRVQAAAVGSSLRLVIAVHVNDAATDFGEAPAMIDRVHREIERIGATVPAIVLDAGYWRPSTLAEVEDQPHVLIADPQEPKGDRAEPGRTAKQFHRSRFERAADGSSVVCPGGKPMKGPSRRGEGLQLEERWTGTGCDGCPLKSSCTTAKAREVTFKPEADRVSQVMRDRLKQDRESDRHYTRRIGTVEPVFSIWQQTLRFNRASSRHPMTIRAEVALIALAGNLERLSHYAEALVVLAIYVEFQGLARIRLGFVGLRFRLWPTL